MYHIAICDDDQNFIDKTKKLLLSLGLDKDKTVFYAYHSGEELVQSLPMTSQIDLLILDIVLPGIKGDETARKFREYFPNALLVFCSGISEPTTESFKTTPFRYLIKHYDDSDLKKEFKVIIERMKENKSEPFIIAHWKKKFVRLALSEISHISILRKKTQIHLMESSKHRELDSPLICEEKIDELYDLLKEYDFEYAHRSYIVNLRYIKRKKNTELEMMDGTLLSVSRSKEKQLHDSWMRCVTLKY
ncbi:MAG: response regulator transcription factor [Lachnospiraceae bacterium]|nr:response regulator transcription factor [Lachnospiraceae bacterium]